MYKDASLLLDIPHRLAFGTEPRWLGAIIPQGVIGVYMLLRDRRPFYVGRSDHCVLTRLRKHPWLCEASHVVWEPCATPRHAYHQESAWYHFLLIEGSIRNRVHPARPTNYRAYCPFCDTRDMEGLKYVLPHLCVQSVVTASPTEPAVCAKTN